MKSSKATSKKASKASRARTASTKPAKKVWQRANYVPAPNFYQLNAACSHVNAAFGNFGCYLVGSAIERRDFRDVDVRFIMCDEAYDRLFRNEHGYINPLWSLLCVVISAWLSAQANLPVDFQIQRQTRANAEHDGPRQPLGVFIDFPGELPDQTSK